MRAKTDLKQYDAYANLFPTTRLARMVAQNLAVSRSKIVIRIEEERTPSHEAR